MEIYATEGGSQVALVVKEPACESKSCRRRGLDHWIGKITWGKKLQLLYSCLANLMYRGSWLQYMRSQRVGHD